MKKILTFVVFAWCALQLNAQTGYAVTGLNLMPNTSTTRCDTAITVSFWAQSAANNAQSTSTLPFIITGTNFVPSQFQFNISWGDGTSYQGNGGVSTTGTSITLNPSPAHTYPGPGTYSVVASVFNFANQTVAVDTVVMTLGSCQIPVYSMVQLDCNNDGVIESTLNTPVPLILTGSGQAYNGTTANNYYLFTGIEPGFYTISVDPAWLTANNYTVGNIQGPAVMTAGMGAQTVVITLNCGNGGGNTGTMCVNGQVFCDQDGNGVYSAGDVLISNAPVSVNFGNGSIVTYTNAQGSYNASYTGSINGTSIVSISSNWLTQHGYSAANLVDTILNIPCNAGAVPATASFPINCGQNPGNTNCFSGYVFCDSNNNGIMDPNELPIPFAPVILNATPQFNNISTVTVYTDSTGYFTYCGQLTNNNYVTATINQNYLSYLGYTANFFMVTIVANQPANLPINCGGNGGNTCADLWTTVTPWIGYYQNSLAYVKLSWGNYGPSASGAYTLTFTFPAGVTVNAASINTLGYTISGNTITWNLANLNSGSSNMDVITFNVPGGIANGTPHYFTSTISPNGTMQDCNQQNNGGNLLQLVGNSYDPNDKNVVRNSFYQDNIIYSASQIEMGIDDILTYTIRFQNTGTAPAQNIVVVDTLDPQLDFTTFSLVSSSHNVDVVDMGNGILHFEFNGIWLPDSTSNEPASHGEFTYRIQENSGNPLNSEITNTGYIYFDWNAPIITNTTYNINIQSESLISNTLNYSVYPNPANDIIQIKLDGDFHCQLMDMSGKIIQRSSHHNHGTMDLSKLTSGVYLINIIQHDENSMVKIIKN